MSICKKFNVRKIFSKETHTWLKEIHYAKRIPPITHSFGLFDIEKKIMVGVVTYGSPPAAIESQYWEQNILELNRLVVQENLGKNVLSFFVSTSLKMLPNNIVILSYADTEMGHHGYIYQSTNWIYTGIGAIGATSYLLTTGQLIHGKTYKKEKHKTIIDKKIHAKGKHRYFYFNGDKKFKRDMLKKLKDRWTIQDYPKGENERYKIIDNIQKQQTLI